MLIIQSYPKGSDRGMLYLFLFLHIICLPATIIGALVMGLYAFAVIDGIVFLLLFVVWIILGRK